MRDKNTFAAEGRAVVVLQCVAAEGRLHLGRAGCAQGRTFSPPKPQDGRQPHGVNYSHSKIKGPFLLSLTKTVHKCLESTRRKRVGGKWPSLCPLTAVRMGVKSPRAGLHRWAALGGHGTGCPGPLGLCCTSALWGVQGFNGCVKHCFLWFAWGLVRTRLSCVHFIVSYIQCENMCHSPPADVC